MHKYSRILVLGDRGMVGSALVRKLEDAGYTSVWGVDREELDLRNFTEAMYQLRDAEYVFVAAATVGGIRANSTLPADFIWDNLRIAASVIKAAACNNVKKLVHLGSSCIYPRHCHQPMRETDLLSGPLEPTNEPYAVAKIAGAIMCESFNRQHGTNFICAMPTNLYGPGDNYDPDNSHVVPALIRKMHEAQLQELPSVTLWGSGQPRREVMHVSDCADALVHMMEHVDASALPERRPLVNVGIGEDCTIAELAETIAEVVGYQGEIRWDTSEPDGMPRKLLDVSLLQKLGWPGAQIGLREGMRNAFGWYLENVAEPAPGAAAGAFEADAEG